MGGTADPQGAPRGVDRLGFTPGLVVQEFGYDDDVDDDLRTEIEEVVDGPLVAEDYDDVTDAALIWWRSADGDLTDTLVDAQTVLEDGCPIWVLTPKSGLAGHVPHGDIEEAATTAGLHVTSTFVIAPGWSATRISPRGRAR